ncbi:MAG: winged helix-turn-helix transcriptional regulator [Gammaproteobacteria bacterium]|nr:winged helix-turn-helix transcriptional regulator [Gammaproteobacteria bacterium]
MDIETIVKVTSRAWSLDILASMQSGVPGRQAPLLSSIGANRTAFAKSLAHLVDLGLLVRNPGHGHPLRPEYRLTSEGLEISKIAGKIAQAGLSDTELAALRRTWTVPVLTVIHTPRRFTEIKSDLISITDRSLSKSLDQLQELEWLKRKIDISGRPPRPTYQAANIGIKICQTVNDGL